MLLRWLIKIKLASYKGASKRVIGAAFSLLVMFVIFGPGVLSAVYRIIASGIGSAGQRQTASLFSSVFLTWVILGAVFQIHFAWQIDWTRTLQLPVSLRRAYLTKQLIGLIGPWMLIFLPAWLWLAWSLSQSPIGFFLLLVVIIEFVILTNQATGVLGYFIGEIDRSVLRGVFLYFCMILISILMFAGLKAAIAQDNSTLTKLGRQVNSLQQLSIWEFLPGAVAAKAFRFAAAADLASLTLALGLAAIAIVIGGAMEIWTIRKSYLIRERGFISAEGRRPSRLVSWLSLMEMRPAAAFLIKDLKILFSYRPFFVVYLFIAAYAPAFIVFVQPPGLFFVELMCVFPLLPMAHVKSNLLGPDVTSLKNVFSMPAHIVDVVRAKGAALNYFLLTVIGATIVAGLITGNLELNLSETIILSLFLVSQFYCWNILGLYCSVLFPDPVDTKGASQGEGGQLASLFLLVSNPLLLGVFALVQKLGERLGGALPTLAICLIMTASIIAFYYRLLIPNLKARANEKREQLYLTMSKNLSAT